MPTRCPRVRHVLTGTFNTASLHLLAFDTLTRTLVLVRSVTEAQGPHQFLALGHGPLSLQGEPSFKAVYATSWAQPPTLSAWSILGLDEQAGSSIEQAGKVSLSWLSTVPITATSSYVHVQPPPFASLTAPSYGVPPGPARYLYSAGGPTGEVHLIDHHTGALVGAQSKAQELVFLKDGADALAGADKTRKALRHGAHSIDISIDQLAFVADLGRNAILTYRRSSQDGRLTWLSETASPRQGDGPRHVVPSPDGRFIYSVTEHTSYVDVYALLDKDTGKLAHKYSLDILPQGHNRSSFRGDTVRLSPSGRALIATTRGKTATTQGWATSWSLVRLHNLREDEDPSSSLLSRWQTPTSGGKANALEWAPRFEPPAPAGDEVERPCDVGQTPSSKDDDYAVLTDDSQGLVLILHWDGCELTELARIQLPGRGVPSLGEGDLEGASHAIWLS